MRLFCFKAWDTLMRSASECFTELSESCLCCDSPPGQGETGGRALIWLLVHRIQPAPKPLLQFRPWTTLFSPCWLALFQAILLLYCFYIFVPGTNQLLIYLTDKKLCIQLTKARFDWVHSHPRPLFLLIPDDPSLTLITFKEEARSGHEDEVNDEILKPLVSPLKAQPHTYQFGTEDSCKNFRRFFFVKKYDFWMLVSSLNCDLRYERAKTWKLISSQLWTPRVSRSSTFTIFKINFGLKKYTAGFHTLFKELKVWSCAWWARWSLTVTLFILFRLSCCKYSASFTFYGRKCGKLTTDVSNQEWWLRQFLPGLPL